MWNHDRSLLLSLFAVRIFFIAWLIAFIGGYYIVEAYVSYLNQKELFLAVLLPAYGCLIFGFFILIHLHRLLTHIKDNQVFCTSNVQDLRKISWLCIIIALISLIAVLWYLPFFIVSVAFAFIGLIVRIIKNIIAEAIIIKEENDYTI